MFTRILFSKKALFQRGRTWFAGLCLVLGIMLFPGCDDKDDSGNLIGTWAGQYDGYEITASTLTYNGYADLAHPEWSNYSFTGTIKNSPDFTKDSGVIIIEYTTKPIYGTYDDTGTNLIGGTVPTGNFFGIYWRELTDYSVKLANAYDPKNTETETTTLPLATEKFTPEAESNFVGWDSVHPQGKQ